MLGYFWFGTNTDTIFIWGAQLEAGAFPTSYIPTTTAAVTRQDDSALMTGANFTSWYRADEGTMFAEYSRISDKNPNGNQIPWMLSDGTGNNMLCVTDAANGTADRVLMVNGGAGQVNMGSVNYAANQVIKRAYGWAENSVATISSIGTLSEDTSAAIPVVDRLTIGYAPYFGSSRINGHIRRLVYWPRRRPNAALQRMTA